MLPVTISGVEERSLARRHGIQAGETLLSINGHPIADVLDYRFYLTEQKLLLELEGPCGPRTVHLRKKDPYDDIGLQFETYLMDKQHSCRNKCVFCFIDQLPPGHAAVAVFQGRRQPAVLSVRQLHHPDQPQ